MVIGRAHEGASRGLSCPVSGFGSLLAWVCTVCENSLKCTLTISVLYVNKKSYYKKIKWEYGKNHCPHLIKES